MQTPKQNTRGFPRKLCPPNDLGTHKILLWHLFWNRLSPVSVSVNAAADERKSELIFPAGREHEENSEPHSLPPLPGSNSSIGHCSRDGSALKT